MATKKARVVTFAGVEWKKGPNGLGRFVGGLALEITRQEDVWEIGLWDEQDPGSVLGPAGSDEPRCLAFVVSAADDTRADGGIEAAANDAVEMLDTFVQRVKKLQARTRCDDRGAS